MFCMLQISTSSPTDHSRYVSDGVQVALVSATYPRGLDTMLEPVLSVSCPTEEIHFYEMKSKRKGHKISIIV